MIMLLMTMMMIIIIIIVAVVPMITLIMPKMRHSQRHTLLLAFLEENRFLFTCFNTLIVLNNACVAP